MNFHHKITKANNRHTFRVDSIVEHDGKQYVQTMFGRAGLPEYVLKSFMKLSELNEQFLKDRIAHHHRQICGRFERIQHPKMEPILDMRV